MATVTAFIRTSSNKIKKSNVRFRLRDGRDLQLFYKSTLIIDPSIWDANKQEIKAKIIIDTNLRAEFNQHVAKLKNTILNAYDSYQFKEGITSEILETEIDKILHPEKYNLIQKPKSFIETFTEFIEQRKISDVRKRNFRVINRALQRFVLYNRTIGINDFQLTFDGVTSKMLQDIEFFFLNEPKIFEEYPEIYKLIPETRTPQQRGQNTLNDIFTKLRTFFIWANEQELTTNEPFKKFKIEDCAYGTPVYISIAERNQIYNTNLSEFPELEIQRDIFVFQCLIGCRVGDLYKLTKNNIIRGAVEYIPRKTKDGNPVTVRVPLIPNAKQILARYNDYKGSSLLPFISEPKYNNQIKEIFKLSEITRIVTILNPTTRETEQTPINEIASSHLARRCFVGNLYKKVKDPNLVGALSGHKEGSKAFTRYREIDEEMKTDLVNMLE